VTYFIITVFIYIMQEKNRLFILDLFRNCVDRISNMRNFIARIASPTGSNDKYSDTRGSSGSSSGIVCKREREPDSMVNVKYEAKHSVSRSIHGGSTVTVPTLVHIDLCSDDEQEVCITSKSSKENGSNCTSEASTDISLKRTLDATYGHSHSHSSAAVKDECSIVDMTNVNHTQQMNGSSNSGSSISTVQKHTHKKMCHQSSTAASAMSNSGTKWTCSVCTFCHKERGCELFLQCSLCGSPRST